MGQTDMPIIDSLETRQKINYSQAAPSGEDNPLDEPATSLSVPIVNLESSDRREPSAIEQSVAETLGPVTLEEKIQKQAVQGRLEQFGYDVFSQVPTTYAPVKDIPVPPGYSIGPGDTIVIQIYGKTSVEYRLVVTRDGRLLVPELGPVQVAGLTFSEVKDKLTERFSRQTIGAKTDITMGELRSIRIYVFGDVVKPGTYTISGLSTLMNALLTCGGIKRTGTLRNIQLKRQGYTVSEFDMYDVLLYGDTGNDSWLKHGDVIFVPSIGPTAGIGGEVQRPAIYELKTERTVEELFQLCGGLLPGASLTQAHIERIADNKNRTLIDLDLNSIRGLKTRLQDGDLIRIFPVADIMDNVVLLSGHVRNPGGYQYQTDMRLSQLIKSAQDLLPNADVGFALIRREIRNERRIEVHYADPFLSMEKPFSDSDFPLMPRDEVIIFDLGQPRAKKLREIVQQLRIQKNSGRLPMIFDIRGHIRYPGTFPLAPGARLMDAINLAGGVLPGTDTGYCLITRESLPDRLIKIFSVNLKPGTPNPLSSNPFINPRDKIYVFDFEINRADLIKSDINTLKKQAGYDTFAPVVSVLGWIRHPGTYPLEPGMSIKNLVRAGGGLKENAYGIGAEITRYKLVKGQKRIAEHILVDFEKILAGDSEADIELQPYDYLNLHKKPEWQQDIVVELAGEVVFPGKYPVKKKETLSDVIWRAGGLTEYAYMYGAVFIREEVRLKQQESLDRIKENLDDLLVQIHLSPSVNNTEKMPSGEHKHLVNRVIEKLKPVKALGRMVIDLEAAMNKESYADIVMKNNDKLYVPMKSDEVTVMGEVYYATSHLYKEDLGSRDYIDLSGGTTVLARKKDAYVVQANGEVNSLKPGGWFRCSKNMQVSPGATIYVPINVDRINRLETIQSWTQIIYQLAISAASLSVVGLF